MTNRLRSSLMRRVSFGGALSEDELETLRRIVDNQVRRADRDREERVERRAELRRGTGVTR